MEAKTNFRIQFPSEIKLYIMDDLYAFAFVFIFAFILEGF